MSMKTANEIKGYNPLSVEPFSENWVEYRLLYRCARTCYR